MSDATNELDNQLSAGGYVAVGASSASKLTVDSVAANLYRHRALGDRAVVRLNAEALSKADHLEMEVLGFGEPQPLGVVAERKRRALGSPGWALVNDPKHARFALDVVKQFKRAARRARSKPGH